MVVQSDVGVILHFSVSSLVLLALARHCLTDFELFAVQLFD